MLYHNKKRLRIYLKNKYFKYKYNYYKNLNKVFTINGLCVIYIDGTLMCFNLKDPIEEILYKELVEELDKGFI